MAKRMMKSASMLALALLLLVQLAVPAFAAQPAPAIYEADTPESADEPDSSAPGDEAPEESEPPEDDTPPDEEEALPAASEPETDVVIVGEGEADTAAVNPDQNWSDMIVGNSLTWGSAGTNIELNPGYRIRVSADAGSPSALTVITVKKSETVYPELPTEAMIEFMGGVEVENLRIQVVDPGMTLILKNVKLTTSSSALKASDDTEAAVGFLAETSTTAAPASLNGTLQFVGENIVRANGLSADGLRGRAITFEGADAGSSFTAVGAPAVAEEGAGTEGDGHRAGHGIHLADSVAFPLYDGSHSNDTAFVPGILTVEAGSSVTGIGGDAIRTGRTSCHGGMGVYARGSANIRGKVHGEGGKAPEGAGLHMDTVYMHGVLISPTGHGTWTPTTVATGGEVSGVGGHHRLAAGVWIKSRSTVSGTVTGTGGYYPSTNPSCYGVDLDDVTTADTTVITGVGGGNNTFGSYETGAGVNLDVADGTALRGTITGTSGSNQNTDDFLTPGWGIAVRDGDSPLDVYADMTGLGGHGGSGGQGGICFQVDAVIHGTINEGASFTGQRRPSIWTSGDLKIAEGATVYASGATQDFHESIRVSDLLEIDGTVVSTAQSVITSTSALSDAHPVAGIRAGGLKVGASANITVRPSWENKQPSFSGSDKNLVRRKLEINGFPILVTDTQAGAPPTVAEIHEDATIVNGDGTPLYMVRLEDQNAEKNACGLFLADGMRTYGEFATYNSAACVLVPTGTYNVMNTWNFGQNYSSDPNKYSYDVCLPHTVLANHNNVYEFDAGVTGYTQTPPPASALAPAPTAVSFGRSTLSLDVGDTHTLDVSFTPANANRVLFWAVKDPTGAITLKDGVITGVADGNATITAYSFKGDIETALDVTVGSGTPAAPTLKITKDGAPFTRGEVTLGGAPLQLEATFTGVAEAPSVTWKSNKEGVAIVSSSGLVTAKGVGTGATITASATVGGKSLSATCTIDVVEAPVELTHVSITPTHSQLALGRSRTLYVQPNTGASLDGADIAWDLLDEDPAGAMTLTPAEDGKSAELKASKTTLGTATVQVVVTPEGGTALAPATLDIRVVEGIDALFFVDALAGGTATATDLVLPAGADYDLNDYLKTSPGGMLANTDRFEVAFTKIDNKTAKLGADGNLTAKAPGVVTVTAKVTDKEAGEDEAAELSAAISVKVVAGLNTVTLSQTADKKLAAGKSFTVKASYEPSNVSLKSVFWSSSNAAVADVNQNGKVTAKAPGRATITVRVTPYAFGAEPKDVVGDAIVQSCNVIVPATRVVITDDTDDVTGQTLRLVPDTFEDGSGDATPLVNFKSIDLKAEALTEDDSETIISWASSDAKAPTKIVRLVEGANGAVTVEALSPGTVTLTAKARHGKTAKVKVQVFVPVKVIDLEFKDSATNGTKDIMLDTTRTLVAHFNASFGKAPSNTSLDWSIKPGSDACVTVKNGVVKGIAPGVATVVAASRQDGRIKGEMRVVVLAPVTKAVLNQKSFTMMPTDSRTLSLTLNDGGPYSTTRPDGTPGDYTTFEWKVDGGLEFADSGDGTSNLTEPTLTAAGITQRTEATVSVMVTSGGKAALKAPLKLKVTVLPPGDTSYTPVDKVTVKPSTKKPTTAKPLLVGGSFTPSLEILPKTPSNKSVIWSVSLSAPGDWTEYISLNQSTGAIKGIGSSGGTVLTLTATPADGSAADLADASYSFTVVQRATGVKVARVDESADPIELEVGDTIGLKAIVGPASADNQKVKWKTSGGAATLNVSTSTATDLPVTVTAKSAGTVTITATSADGSKKAGTIKVKVVQQPYDIIITNKPQKPGEDYAEHTLFRGGSITLKAKMNAATTVKGTKIKAQAAPSNKKVDWIVVAEYSAKNPGIEAPEGSIVKMKNGKVTALADGWAEIRVMPQGVASAPVSGITVHKKSGKTIKPTDYCNTIKITVNVPVTKLAMQQKKFSMQPGTTLTLNALTTPELALLSASHSPIKWTLKGATGAITLTQAGEQTGKTFDTYTGADITITGAPTGGTVTLTATATGSKKISASVKITVAASAKPTQTFGIVKSATWIQRGGSETLKVSMTAGKDKKTGKDTTPSNTNKRWYIEEYNWGDDLGDSSVTARGSIATVSQAGKVTVKGDGWAVVYAEAVEDPAAFNDSCVVYCVPKR